MSRGPARISAFDIRRVLLDDDVLADLRRRLAGARRGPELGPGWGRGVPSGWLDDLLRDWQRYDPSELAHTLGELGQLRVELDAGAVHLIHVPGRGPDPLPLLLTHGWPGSFLEYLKLIPLLSDPGSHQASAADAFTLIVPSLPGYGFSSAAAPEDVTGRQVAGLWHALMTELGYERYVAHGSDLGAGVTGWLARDHPHAVAGIHLATPGLAAVPGTQSSAEQAYAAAVRDWTAEEGGYLHQHATKPATLGAALTDSPAGLATWIGEKIVAWSATRADGNPAFDRDLLLATLTLYWTTNTITTSLLPYWAHRHDPGASLPAGNPSPVPTTITVFGGERVPFPKPPRELAARYFTLAGWTERSVGGHFPAVAEPELLAGILRDAFRPARLGS